MADRYFAVLSPTTEGDERTCVVLASDYDRLEAAARQLLSLVANKGQPMSHPDNQALYNAGDTIQVNEGNLWNLQMVLGSSNDGGTEHGG